MVLGDGVWAEPVPTLNRRRGLVECRENASRVEKFRRTFNHAASNRAESAWEVEFPSWTWEVGIGERCVTCCGAVGCSYPVGMACPMLFRSGMNQDTGPTGSNEAIAREMETAFRTAERCYSDGKPGAAAAVLTEAKGLDLMNSAVSEALAVMLFHSGDATGAVRELSRALVLESGNTELLMKMAAAALQSSDFELFESSIARVFALKPDHLEALRMLARLNLDQGRFPDAAGYFLRLVRLVPGDIDSLLGIGRCMCELGSTEVSMASYDRVLMLDPGHPIALENLNVLRARAGLPILKLESSPSMPDPSEILSETEKRLAEGDVTGAVSGLVAGTTLHPLDASLWISLGTLLFSTGRVAEALRPLRRGCELAPHLPDTWVQTALAAWSSGDVPSYEGAIAQALSIDPQHRAARSLQARTHLQSGRWMEAAKAYLGLCNEWPQAVDYLLPLGVCFVKLGSISDAREIFERVLELEPGNPTATENLSFVQRLDRAQEPVAV